MSVGSAPHYKSHWLNGVEAGAAFTGDLDLEMSVPPLPPSTTTPHQLSTVSLPLLSSRPLFSFTAGFSLPPLLAFSLPILL